MGMAASVKRAPFQRLAARITREGREWVRFSRRTFDKTA